MPVTISVRADLNKLQRALDEFTRKQIPFATAKALTATAKRVQEAETKALITIFDNPTPFTMRSIGVKAARKNDLAAVVFVKDIAARYLEPYEFGGKHVLNSRALLNPKDIGTNQYGNLPKSTLARLKGRPDVFIGAVKTKAGATINGVWQRATDTKRPAPLNTKGKRLGKLNKTGSLKLLIRFGDALEVKQHLGYRARAKKIVDTVLRAEFEKALAEAMRTAR